MMNKIKIKESSIIEKVFLIESPYSQDNRGGFLKLYEDVWDNEMIDFHCTECFVSTSSKNVIRGLHFQTFHPQKKLVNVIHGKVFDVVVDLRKESKTFGKWEGFYLSEMEHQGILIPPGCAHGFLALEDMNVMSYICMGNYDKNTDTGIIYNDPNLGISWPIENQADIIMSERDMNLMTFVDFCNNEKFVYGF